MYIYIGQCWVCSTAYILHIDCVHLKLPHPIGPLAAAGPGSSEREGLVLWINIWPRIHKWWSISMSISLESIYVYWKSSNYIYIESSIYIYTYTEILYNVASRQTRSQKLSRTSIGAPQHKKGHKKTVLSRNGGFSETCGQEYHARKLSCAERDGMERSSECC